MGGYVKALCPPKKTHPLSPLFLHSRTHVSPMERDMGLVSVGEIRGADTYGEINGARVCAQQNGQQCLDSHSSYTRHICTHVCTYI